MAGNTLGRAVVDFGANTATLQTDMSRAVGIVDKAIADINVTINKAGSGANFNGVSTQVKGLESDFKRLQGVISGVFGVGIGVAAIKQVMDLADEYQGVSNRIQTVTANAQDLARVQAQVFKVAQDTGAALDDTAKMYQRLEQSIQGSGKSQAEAQQQAISLTKTLNQEIVVSGASAGEASRSIMDLVHGLSGGVLHAQQLRPIMRQMPDLAKQIADGLGLSAKQFEELVHKGLPAVDVLKALESQAGKIDERFNALPKTFARSWQELHNAVEQYVGKASQASAVSDTLKAAISGIATNIDTVATGAQAVGIAMGAWLGGKTLQSLSAMALGLRDAVTAQGAYKTAAILSAEADVASATAQRAALAATIANTDARNDLRIAEINGLNATGAALATEIAALERESVAGTNVLATTERLIAARTELAVVTARTAEVEGAMAAAQAKATLAENEETAATIRLTESKAALVVAQTEATAVTGLFARAGAGLFAAIGGWPTVILAAAAGVYYLATSMTEAQAEAKKLDTITRQLAESHSILTPAMVNSAQAALQEAQAMAQLAQAKADQAAKEAAAAQASNASTTEYVQAADAAQYYAGVAQTLTDKANGLAVALRFVNVQAGSNGTALANWADGIKGALVQIEGMNDGLDKEGEKLIEQAATYKKGHAAVVEYEKAHELAKLSVGATAEQIALLSTELDKSYAKKLEGAQALDIATAAAKNHTAALREQHKEETAQQAAQKRYTQDVQTLANLEEQLSSGLGGPYLAALKAYQKGIDLTAKTWQDAVDGGTATDELLGRLSDDQEHLGDVMDETNVKIKEQHNAFADQANQLNQLIAIQGVLPKYQEAITDGLRKYDDLLKSHYDFYGHYIDDEEKLKKALDDQLPTYVKNQQAIKDLAEEQRKATQQWGDFADAIFDAATKSGNFLKNLLNNLKSIVTQMLKEWFRTKVIGTFTGNGSSGSILSAFMGGADSTGGIWNMAAQYAAGSLGGDSSQAGNVTGGSGSGLFSSSGWTSAGQKLWAGFSGSATAGTSIWGTWGGSTASGGTGVWSPGMGTTAATYAGGIAGAYYGYHQGDGGLGTVGSTVAYGALGAGIAGTAAGVAGGASLGAAAGGAYAGIASASWIPIVGWIAALAAVVDYASGGKIFGTKFRPEQSEVALGIGQNGSTASANVDEWKYQSQLSQSLGNFGGLLSPSDWGKKDRRHRDLAISPEMTAAAEQLFKSVQDTMVGSAKQLAIDTPPMIDATLRAVTSYTEKGKVKATKYFVDMLGKSWEEATADLAAQRINAEALVNVVGVAASAKNGPSGNAEVQGLADRWRASANTLADGAQLMLAAQTDIQNGFNFLALGADQSLTAIVDFATGLQKSGQTMTQALAALEQAQAAYNQFVAQFKPAETYASGFQMALSQINAQMKADAAQANALAKAAGAEHAATQDLINIHNKAAQAFVAAVQLLQSQSQSLAARLGYALPTSIDEINAAIAALEGKANTSGEAVSSFGGAMTDAAQQATDAINLLLGDLSPLNDQQKLQTAMQGQIAGTVTPTQVLEIARRLMGSGSDYAHIFAQVQAIGDRTNRGGSADTGGSASASTGLTYEESQQLKELKARQAQVQAQQRHTDALQLAQNIADLASSTGESIQDALDNLGITDITQFMKDLGVSDRAAFEKLITDMESKNDSADESTDDLAKEITTGNSILSTILDVVIDYTHSTRTNPSTVATAPAAASPLLAPQRGTRGGGIPMTHIR